MNGTSNNSAARLQVCVREDAVWVKISGRANFTVSVDFKALINGLRAQGRRRFVLDLTDCLLMDSTFLGVLARISLDMAETEQPGEPRSIELLNPSERVSDMLDNLGVLSLFGVLRCSPDAGVKLEEVALTKGQVSKAENSRNCLEAHRALMEVCAENKARFKDVTKFLEEDLKKNSE
ncbi:MAG: STAS domain-containing protein [Verrucomicrobia bacterium]|nr:STAS domain-containing protein [Verrucomicrobiota bacterium]